jgi:uncharacterized protein (TIGR00369 family)
MPPVEEQVHIGATIGMHVMERGDGRCVIRWDAGREYGFPTATGQVIHGGMVTTILDSAMGGAAWSVLNDQEAFLTADLRVEFYRATRPGPLVALGTVLKRTSRMVFCAAELFDVDGRLTAGSRCTQAVLPADGRAGRADPTKRDFDLRG